jgi:hypothetical protein
VGAQRIIERERRWAAPAAVAAVLTFALYVVSFIIDRTADLYADASEKLQLESLNDHAGTILFSSGVRAAAFLLLPIPILYLFRAAQARNPRVQAAMVGFVFIGPILFAAQGVVQAIGAGQAADDFVGLSPEEKRSYAELQGQVKRDPETIDEVTIYTGGEAPTLEVQQSDDSFYAVTDFGKQEEKVVGGLPAMLDDKGVDNETDDDPEAQPGDAQAAHITSESSTLQTAQAVLLPAVLGLIVMMIYVPLQAQRVGLLSRFFSSLGMALGASMVLLLPVALLGVLVWTGYLGLLFVNRVPGGRPPAWDVGEAVPWPRPDAREASPEGGEETIEGTATEASGTAPSEDRSQPAKRKRKRRS